MAIESPAELLWREMRLAVSPYPAGVVDVPAPIRGTAFFPGGLGLWQQDSGARAHFPVGQIMVLGQDFNSIRTYEEAQRAGTEVGSSATWRELRQILRDSNISLDQCFFTNVYMGLRDGRRETGRFPGARDDAFVQRCLAFFTKQLEVVRPRLILTLGLEPIRVLTSNLFHLTPPKTLAACAEIYPAIPLVHGSVTVVALTHPSFYRANVWRRRYAQLTGMEAEKTMIAEGLKIAFKDSKRA